MYRNSTRFVAMLWWHTLVPRDNNNSIIIMNLAMWSVLVSVDDDVTRSPSIDMHLLLNLNLNLKST